ncbi:hypothetical protein B0H16DRAFT_1773287 [Mycena metata]|uniref:Uncharacterized protein n=1 Tax=Mycena metata TaxID=1033252 RepID=A0AAD7HY45_9AGAR|nr:hypothetical protein B0H16DRAFT_1773287 [Mycena metata]
MRSKNSYQLLASLEAFTDFSVQTVLKGAWQGATLITGRRLGGMGARSGGSRVHYGSAYSSKHLRYEMGLGGYSGSMIGCSVQQETREDLRIRGRVAASGPELGCKLSRGLTSGCTSSSSADAAVWGTCELIEDGIQRGRVLRKNEKQNFRMHESLNTLSSFTIGFEWWKPREEAPRRKLRTKPTKAAEKTQGEGRTHDERPWSILDAVTGADAEKTPLMRESAPDGDDRDVMAR